MKTITGRITATLVYVALAAGSFCALYTGHCALEALFAFLYFGVCGPLILFVIWEPS